MILNQACQDAQSGRSLNSLLSSHFRAPSSPSFSRNQINRTVSPQHRPPPDDSIFFFFKCPDPTRPDSRAPGSMAGITHDFSLPNSSFFNIYNDMSITTTPAPSLLGGACNYIDLNGANGQKCGCRRFWSRATSARFSAGSPTGYSQAFPPGDASPSADSVAFCMCSHHACYHDDIREAPASIATTTNAVGFPVPDRKMSDPVLIASP